MAKFDPEYLRGLDALLNSADDTDEDETIATDDIVENDLYNNDITIRGTEQRLLYFVIDKSGSMYNNGLEEEVIQLLRRISELLDMRDDLKNSIQIATTFFGSTIDMHPFMYGEKIDTNYRADAVGSCLYDAIVKSANNMIYQYDTLARENLISARMIIITDGADDGSLEYTKDDVNAVLNKLNERDINVLLPKFKSKDISYLTKIFPTVRLASFDDYHEIERNFYFFSQRVIREKDLT